MVVIRLSRGGAKARPFYNIVVADKRVRRDGRFIERIGFYNPLAKDGEEKLRVAQDRLTYWRGVGAQASPTVERLLKAGVLPATAPAANTAPQPSPPANRPNEELVVTGTRSEVISTPDRVSFSVANDLQVQTGTLADALRAALPRRHAAV